MKRCPDTITSFVMLMPVIKNHSGKFVRRRGYHDSIEVDLPCHRIVCDHCDGTSSHVNPNIDGHGLSQEDFDQDPDFRESYFNGDYDVACDQCKGARVVDVVNYEALTPKMQRRYNAYLDQRNADEQEAAFERRWCV